jgi:phosphoglycolate phosphatase
VAKQLKYKLAIFDFDGTICATREAIVYCIKQTFSALDTPISKENLINHTVASGMGLDETFKILNPLFFKQKPHDLNHWIATYRYIYLKEGLGKTYIYNGVKKIFNKFFANNIAIIIVSNKGIDAINAALKHFGLIDYVKLVIGDTKGIKKKPDPMLFDNIIKPKFNNIDLKEMFVIGDTKADILFAKNIGTDSCWVSYGYGKEEECMALMPTMKIAEINELKFIKPDFDWDL